MVPPWSLQEEELDFEGEMKQAAKGICPVSTNLVTLEGGIGAQVLLSLASTAPRSPQDHDPAAP
jgi:hypothetical protein